MQELIASQANYNYDNNNKLLILGENRQFVIKMFSKINYMNNTTNINYY